MQISFENRLQQIRPDLELTNKLSSDVIFEFLNAATLRFCREQYVLEDQTVTGSRAFRKVNDAMKGLSTRIQLPVDKPTGDADSFTTYMVRVKLPSNFMYYIRSTSKITSNYKWKEAPASISGEEPDVITKEPKNLFITPNKTIKEDEIDRVLTTYYNRPILINPYVVLTESQETTAVEPDYDATDPNDNLWLNVIHDSYTTIEAVDLYYYRRPRKFDVIGVDGKNILDHCELSNNVHMEIVELAVQMFLNDTRYAVTEQQVPQRQAQAQQQRNAQ